ncbi:MAG: L-2-amino-thiazoline-4-carboxylic acid hydrolase [Candidatus Rokuibacteriota bacterium]
MRTPMPPDNLNEIGALKRRERVGGESLTHFAGALEDWKKGDAYRLSCNRDFSLIEGFNPAVKLTRTRTVMEGTSHCDFRFELRRPSKQPSA